ncbi:MAG: hypothetical protein K9N47_15165 [Prosthecobacter sp.]|uniref:hypothetical protein n=1 Tax=Prosthecobacter sp. TaxID=1965333 RepID=UPI0025CC84DD|nr:hypothetical protein [Prosthecobacter sp.]MCF7787468.1 hypothetical protein [Prosthecobacter sp.]
MIHFLKQLVILAVAFQCLIAFGSAETIATNLTTSDGTLENRHATSDNGEYSSEIIWHPKSGGQELVYTASGKKLDDRAWTIEAAFASEGVLSLCRGSRSGALELWQFKKNGIVWTLVARASLGSGTDVYGVTLPDAQTVELQRKDRAIDQLLITDRPLIGSPLYRVVMMNGQDYWPYGRAAGGPTATGEKVREVANHLEVAPPLKSPTIVSTLPQNTLEAKLTLPTLSEEPTSSTPWSIIVVLIVAATGLLWLLLKKRK